MAYCGQCRTENAEGNQYCFRCGADLTAQRTPNLRAGAGGATGDPQETRVDRPFSSSDSAATRVDSGTTVGALEIGALLDRGRYRIDELIDQGGMGAVYRATDTKLGRVVALKVVHGHLLADASGLQRLRTEVRISSDLTHPGIVRVFDLGTDQGIEFYTMEFVRGITLRKAMRQRGAPFGLAEAKRVMLPLLDALAYAHEQRTVHRDVKPENVLLPDGDLGRPKLTDFGIAKALEVETLTRTAMALGTPEYVAPEQIHDAANVDARADLYSVGVMMYELLTGVRPAGVFEPPSELVPALPKAADRLVLQLLQRQPERRPGSAEEVRRDLAAISVKPAPVDRIDEAPRTDGAARATLNDSEAKSAFAAGVAARSARADKGAERTAAKVWPALEQAVRGRQGRSWRNSVVLGLGVLMVVALRAGFPVLNEFFAGLLRERGVYGRLADRVDTGDDRVVLDRGEEKAAPVRVEPKAPASVEPKAPVRAHPGMVRVPAGEFWYGCNQRVDSECEEDEKPGKRLRLDEYWIDETEVTVGAYGNCVRAGRCTEPDTGGSCNWGDEGEAVRGNHPVNCVDRDQASKYCEWAGKRLPSQEEWEKAARGEDGRKYPWGNEPATCRFAVIDDGSGMGCGSGFTTWPVGSKPEGASRYGALDMAGNVWEYASSERGVGRAVRGGSWLDDPRNARVSDHGWYTSDDRNSSGGFRCVQQLP